MQAAFCQAALRIVEGPQPWIGSLNHTSPLHSQALIYKEWQMEDMADTSDGTPISAIDLLILKVKFYAAVVKHSEVE